MSAISPGAPAFILLFFLLLAFPGQAIQGASDGLLLWFHTVLPTLAPAMICTRLILLSGGDHLLMKPVRPLFQKLFSLSETGSFILLSGMLCGYPLGAALCSQARRDGRISTREAAYLLAFCSFPSPMFLAGYIPGQFPGRFPLPLLFLSVYAPVLILSRLARHNSHPDISRESGQPKAVQTIQAFQIQEQARSAPEDSLNGILYEVCDVMVLIGSYLMLFSVLARFLSTAAWIPQPVTALLCAVFEMTTGIRQICLTFPPALCLPACAACAAFGGISGIFQTHSVIAYDSLFSQGRKNAGFDIRHYVGWKLLHAGLSALILTVLQLLLPLGSPLRL